MINTGIKIAPYTAEYRASLIEALIQLQAHEYQLSDTRKAPTLKVAEDYVEVMYQTVQEKGGQVFLAFQGEVFAGFITYHFVSEETILEEETSNNYCLISDICVLPPFRNKVLRELSLTQ